MTVKDIEAKAKEYRELNQFMKQLQDEADAVKQEIIAEMEARDVDTIRTDLFTVHYTAYKSTRFDSARFRAECEPMYESYCKTSEGRRFSVA
jgi:predicted phage-related endonuclease